MLGYPSDLPPVCSYGDFPSHILTTDFLLVYHLFNSWGKKLRSDDIANISWVGGRIPVTHGQDIRILDKVHMPFI